MSKAKIKVFSAYDHERLMQDLEKGKSKRTFNKYFSQGIEYYNTEVLQRNRLEQFLFLGNHKSHWDYLIAARAFLENLPAGRFPHFIAGLSLDKPFLPSILGFSYRSAGVCWYDRKKKLDKEYTEYWGENVNQRLQNGESFMFYPEGTRVIEENSSEMEHFRGGYFIRQIREAGSARDSVVDPLITTVTVDYDMPLESQEPFKSGILWGRKKKKKRRKEKLKVSERLENFARDFVYYGSDALAFITRPLITDSGGYISRFNPLARDTGRAYLKFGEPVRLSSIIREYDKNEIVAVREFVQDSIKRDYEFIQEQKRLQS